MGFPPITLFFNSLEHCAIKSIDFRIIEAILPVPIISSPRINSSNAYEFIESLMKNPRWIFLVETDQTSCGGSLISYNIVL